MAWRVLEHGERRWNVTVAAERRANAAQWTLVFSFRAAPPEQRSFWVSYPLTSLSRAALFAQAEQISNETLVGLIAEHGE
ncbi:MAG TPA: hypothetical protein VEB59_00535 [Gemmatimonadales bacterium]|nr:hypothetical protein [Gemmatimonadales bacterium]